MSSGNQVNYPGSTPGSGPDENYSKTKLTYFGHIIRAQNLCKTFLKGGRIGGKAMYGKEASRMHNCHMPQQDGESWVINVHNYSY